ncbi:MAG: serine esterase [Bdellovibrionaceae bacterium]|nr:serine esterase [Pseudobdellovibrionaceae bacterium]
MIVTDLFRHKYIPARKSSDKLMIVLHGRGDSIRPFYNFQAEIGLYDFHFLLLNAPRKFLDGWSWYGEPPFQSQGVEKIRRKLFILISELEAKGWKPENIFLFGFSQGCLVSADFGIHYPKKLGGIIGVSGYFHFYPRWRNRVAPEARKTPWLFTHGTKDNVLPIQETRFGVEKLREAGLPVDWKEFVKDHSLSEVEYPVIRKWVREKLKSFPG